MTMHQGPVARAHRLLAPRIACLVGTKDRSGDPNLIPVSNVTSISTQPQQVVLAVHTSWTTCANLSRAAGFTLSVPRDTQSEGVWKLGARYPGYPAEDPAEKLATCGLNLPYDRSEHGPVLADGLGWLVCEVIGRLDLGGDHGVFAGQVANVFFDGAVFADDGTPVADLHPLMQVTGNHFTTSGDVTSVDYYSR